MTFNYLYYFKSILRFYFDYLFIFEKGVRFGIDNDYNKEYAEA